MHILGRERQGELERKFRSGAVESGSECHFAKREKVMEEKKEGLLTQLRWITETLESTVGAGLSCQDMGTGAEWKLSPSGSQASREVAGIGCPEAEKEIKAKW